MSGRLLSVLVCAWLVVCVGSARAADITYSVDGTLDFGGGDDPLGLDDATFAYELIIDAAATPFDSGTATDASGSYDYAYFNTSQVGLDLAGTSGGTYDGHYDSASLLMALFGNIVGSPADFSTDTMILAGGFDLDGHSCNFDIYLSFNPGFLTGDPLDLPLYTNSDVAGVDSYTFYLADDGLGQEEQYYFSLANCTSSTDPAPSQIPEPATVALIVLGLALVHRTSTRR